MESASALGGVHSLYGPAAPRSLAGARAHRPRTSRNQGGEHRG